MDERPIIDLENLERAPSDVQDYLEEGNEKRDLIDMIWTFMGPEQRDALEKEVAKYWADWNEEGGKEK